MGREEEGLVVKPQRPRCVSHHLEEDKLEVREPEIFTCSILKKT